MHAAFFERTGPAAEALMLAVLPDPVPGHGELRVRLRRSGVNPSDVKSRAGLRSKTPLAQSVQAHELVESGRAIGNVVVELP